MQEQQIVTVSFFRYQGWRARWWAFQQMGRAPAMLKQVEGLQFVKMLGSGGGKGFSIRPNFGVYGLLGVWEAETAARSFFDRHPGFTDFKNKSTENWTVFLRTVMVHGEWEGQAPFAPTLAFDPNEPVAVLTRATIHTRYLWRFWRFVPPVSRSVHEREGLLFSVGIGELPLVQQATFSLWRNSHWMQAYAYKSRYHQEVVRRTRELGWYKEELFARFRPYASEGSWGGADPLAEVLE